MKRTMPVLILIAILLVGCANSNESKPRALTVFAAASLTDAFTEIGKNFESQNPNVTVTFNFAGSQALRTQIEEGAPADVFASASAKEMDALIAGSFAAKESSQIFLSNKLAVIVPADNPAGIDSLDDLAKYVAVHLGSKTAPRLLKPETLKRLHTPPAGEEYACGWNAIERPWAGGTALMHNGTNTLWYAVMWLAPEKEFAVLSATNVGGAGAETACDEVTVAMINKWLK